MTNRIKTKLESLERDRPVTSGGLSSEIKHALVSLLARRDAWFWPWRCESGGGQSWHILPDFYLRQKSYLSQKSGVKIKADGKGSWKASHELRKGMWQAG